jgi:hypothetical protein
MPVCTSSSACDRVGADGIAGLAIPAAHDAIGIAIGVVKQIADKNAIA